MEEIVTSAEVKEGKVHVKIKGTPADSIYLAWIILRDTAKALGIHVELLIMALMEAGQDETHQP